MDNDEEKSSQTEKEKAATRRKAMAKKRE